MTAFDGNFKTKEVAKPQPPGVCEQMIHEVHDAWAKTTLGSHAQVAELPNKVSEPKTLDFNTPIGVAAFDAANGKGPYSDKAMAAADERFNKLLAA